MSGKAGWIGVFVIAMLLGVGGCDQLGLGPRQAEPVPPAAAPAPVLPNFAVVAGTPYAALGDWADMAAYTPEGLGLSEEDAARLRASMAQSVPAWMASGGGAEALVFTGCGASGCGEGRAVVAVDIATGSAFVGVRDSAGALELVPNPRVEALLRLSSPTRAWDDAQPRATAANEAAP